MIEIGAADGLGDVGRHEVDRNQSMRNAARLDAALCVQRREALRVAGVQAHRVAALAQVGCRRAPAMSRAEDRNRTHSHFTFRVRMWWTSDHGQRGRLVNQSPLMR